MERHASDILRRTRDGEAGLLAFIRCRDPFTAYHAAKVFRRLTCSANARSEVWQRFLIDQSQHDSGSGLGGGSEEKGREADTGGTLREMVMVLQYMMASDTPPLLRALVEESSAAPMQRIGIVDELGAVGLEQEVPEEVREVVYDLVESVVFCDNMQRSKTEGHQAQTHQTPSTHRKTVTDEQGQHKYQSPKARQVRPNRKFVPTLACGLPLKAADAREKKIRRAARVRDERSTLSLSTINFESMEHGGSWETNQIRLLLLETCWMMIGPSNPNNALCAEGLLRQGFFDFILLCLQSRLGDSIEVCLPTLPPLISVTCTRVQTLDRTME